MRMGATTWSAGEPSAELLSWDSEWWGTRIGRADRLMDDWALENTVGCMWLLIPAGEQGEVHRAEAGGARVMDVRIKLECHVNRFWGSSGDVRAATARDEDAIIGIARQAFRGLTRFYADPRFPDERCDDLYENWVRDSLGGWAADVLVYERDEKVAGFVTLHLDDGVASIGLIAVAEEFRGAGVGFALMREVQAWSVGQDATQITVVTQGCNIPAQRCFHRAGFVAAQTDIWLHKHFYDE